MSPINGVEECNDIGDARSKHELPRVGADDMDSPTMNPLVRHGQERRPTQPIIPLNADEIASCESAVNNGSRQMWRRLTR